MKNVFLGLLMWGLSLAGTGCGLRNYQYTPEPPPTEQELAQQARVMAAHAQLMGQLQQSQASVDAAYSQASSNMRRVGEQNLADFKSQVRASEERRATEERENNARRAAALQSLQSSISASQVNSSPPQMPTGLGVPTGRSQLGLDGTTYYEMRDVNGTTYWTNKR